MGYEESAKEVLRLVQFFEGLFTKSSLYCETAIAVDVDPDGKDKIYFKWSPRVRQLQYRGSFNDSWAHAARVFEMEIPGILLKNIEIKCQYLFLELSLFRYQTCLLFHQSFVLDSV